MLNMHESHISVLVIENFPLLREALCVAIANEPGMSVQAATSADTTPPDIVLLALSDNLPEAEQQIAALHHKLPGVPIVALTHEDFTGQEQAAHNYGLQALLPKNTLRTELIHTLHAVAEANDQLRPALFQPA
jgi:DNA-binding NarL/FixJ family response regulator